MFSKLSWPTAATLLGFMALYGFLLYRGIAIPSWLAFAGVVIGHAMAGLFSNTSEVSK